MALAQINLVFLCGLVLAITQGQAAEPFLQRQVQTGGSLLSDLEGALGRDFLRGRLQHFESRLRPMFLSLQKTANGLVSHATARYALHRANLDMHGWSITGLEPTVATINVTSLVGSGILREVLPSHIETILQAHTSPDGFSLRDLAVLVGTIDHSVHEGHRSLLIKVCDLFDLPTLGPMSEQDMMRIVRLYKALFMRGISTENLTAQDAGKIESDTFLIFPGFADASTFLDDERNTLAFSQTHRTNPFKEREASLEIALQVIGQVADHYAHKLSEPECQEIKEDLLTYELGDTGRIRLVDFYRAGLTTRFFYTESKEYLQAIGALDTSDTLWGPKVIVPNYILAKTNCVARTDIYSVCCSNECEGLFGQLEHGIAAAYSTPDQIRSLVATLSSSTVQAPRNLSQTLRNRLDDIALGNGGMVLLHGRLFAQWMHHAFPRECPYPHLTGTTTSLTSKAWTLQTGQASKINVGVPVSMVLGDHVAALDRSLKRPDVESAAEIEGADLMWTAEEENFVEPTLPLSLRAGLSIQTLPPVVLVALCCAALALAVTSRARSVGGAKLEQHFV